MCCCSLPSRHIEFIQYLCFVSSTTPLQLFWLILQSMLFWTDDGRWEVSFTGNKNHNHELNSIKFQISCWYSELIIQLSDYFTQFGRIRKDECAAVRPSIIGSVFNSADRVRHCCSIGGLWKYAGNATNCHFIVLALASLCSFFSKLCPYLDFTFVKCTILILLGMSNAT